MDPNSRLVMFGGSASAAVTATSWALEIDISASSSLTSVALSATGDIYIAGSYYPSGSPFTFGYMASLDEFGGINWQQSLSSNGNGNFSLNAIQIQDSSNLLVGGYSNASGSQRAYLSRVNRSTGAQVSKTESIDSSFVIIEEIGVLSNGNFYVAHGYTSNGIGVSYFNSSLSLQWSSRLSSTGVIDSAYSIVAEPGGDAYVAGTSFLSPSFGANDSILYRVNSSPTLLWQKRYGISSGANDIFEDMALGASNNVYLTGLSRPPGGATDSSIIKTDFGGTILWQTLIQGTRFSTITIDSNGDAYVCGVPSDGTTYLLLIKLSGTNGSILWQRTFSYTPNTASGLNVAKIRHDQNGHVVMVGRLYNNTSNAYSLLAIRYPDDGSITGVYGDYVIGSASKGVNGFTLSEASANLTFSNQNPGFNQGSASQSSVTLTSNITNLT